MTCNVCNKNEALGVAASPFGPISLAYCRECINAPADAYFIIVNMVASAGGDEANLNEWARSYIEPSLRVAGVTREQFYKDVQEAIEDFNW